MEYKEIREKFIQFFEKQNHVLIPSSSLIPEHDASVLLTTAGMQQFKSYFAGQANSYNDKAISIQKCFRMSDIDEVGDKTHLTFFEMFGNFGFNGRVSKKQAIEWAWDFLTSSVWMNIDKSRITASYYNGNRLGTEKDIEAKENDFYWFYKQYDQRRGKDFVKTFAGPLAEWYQELEKKYG